MKKSTFLFISTLICVLGLSAAGKTAGATVQRQALAWVGVNGGNNPSLLAYGTPGGQPLFIDLMNANPPVVETSTDATTWTSHSLPAGEVWSSVKWLDNRFVATGWYWGPYIRPNVSDEEEQTIGIIMTSTDGANWTIVESTNTTPSTLWFSVAFGNGVFTAIGERGEVATSADGITWTRQPDLPGNPESLSILYAGGQFVVVGNNFAAVSTDGTAWTTGLLTGDDYWNSLTYGNGTYVAVSNASNNSFATSADGLNWTVQPFGSGRWFGLTYANGQFIAVGLNGAATSPDGQSWTAAKLPTLPNQSGAWGGNFWYSIAAGDGKILTAMEQCSGVCLALSVGSTATPFRPASGAPLELLPGVASAINPDGTRVALSVSKSAQGVTLSSGSERVVLGLDTTSGAQIPSGSSVTITLSGYESESDVTVWLHSTPLMLKSIRINGSGVAHFSLKIPRGLRGNHTIQIQGIDTTGQLRAIDYGISVKQGSGSLAATGSSLSDVMLLALGFCSLGILLLRKRTSVAT
ncbi:MAG: hypothetical protein WCG62_04690 [Actinomycetes bacterium]